MNETLVVLTRRIPAAGMSVLHDAGVRIEVVEPDPERIVDPRALMSTVRHADVVISLLTEQINRDVLESSPRLRGVANMAVGYNNIDIAAATAMGIPVSNTPGMLTDTTADLTWALLLAVARRIVEADRYMRDGRYRIWGPELMLGADVSRGGSGQPKTLGIIGYGRIGRAVARRAAGFDMRVIAFNPGREGVDEDGTLYVALDDLLQQSDYVCIHAPSSEQTRHMIGERELQMMKPGAFLINVARGDIVDEPALVRALREHRIAGAALDVFEREPAMAAGLAECSNAIIVPHIGSASADTRDRMAVIAATNALAFVRRERAPDTVNAAVYQTPEYVERMRPHG
jgi:glyoxylate reductase